MFSRYIQILREYDWPTVEKGECPETGDEALVIVRDDGPDECYHCGTEVTA